MKYLYLTLLALLIGCGTGTDAKYPKVFGTWQVNSEVDAEWIGVRSMQKPTAQQADTVELRSPQSHHITMTSTSTRGRVQLQYIDSTKFATEIWKDKIDLSGTQFIFPRTTDEITAVEVVSAGFDIGPNRLRMDLSIAYKCDKQLQENPVVWIRFIQKDNAPLRAYKIIVNGFKDAIEIVGC